MKIPYARLYAAYCKDRKEKSQPVKSEQEFRAGLDALAKKNKEAFGELLEAAGWRTE